MARSLLVLLGLCLVQGQEAGSNASHEETVITDAEDEAVKVDWKKVQLQGLRSADYPAQMAALEEARSVIKDMARLDGVEGPCGVIAVKTDETPWKDAASLAPLCGVKMSHNCSMSYSQVICPEECPFMATSMHFPCQFTCEIAKNCSTSNADLPFSDTSLNICEHCQLSGCKWCVTPDTCGECYSGFHLERDSCVFWIADGGWPTYVANGLYILIALILITGVIFYCSKPRSEHEDHNFACIAAGRRHRHLSKVHRWDLASNVQPRRWQSIFVHMGMENIMGVGLPLFYNSICFMFFVSIVGLVTAYVAYASSAVDSIIAVTETNEMSISTAIMDVGNTRHDRMDPAVIVSPLSTCDDRSPFAISDDLEVFAFMSAFSTGALWLTLFVSSLLFARWQRNYSRWFDANHTSMSDFVLLFKGLPETLIDELEIKEWFSSELKRLFPGEQEMMAVEGVSVMYTYSGLNEADVNSMLERLQEQAEHDVGADADKPGRSRDQELAVLREKMIVDRKTVNSWFSGQNPTMKSTGSIFLVFKKTCAKDKILEAVTKGGQKFTHPKTGQALEVQLVKSEPPDVFWQNLHYTDKEIRGNEMKAVMNVLIWFGIINLVISWPWNTYVTIPISKAGSAVGADLAMVNGLIMAILNGILGGQVFGGAYSVGYHRKDKADTFIFIVNILMQLSNTLINVWLSALTSFRNEESNTSMFEPISKSETIGSESEMVQNVYLMMVPSQLFVNTLMGVVNGAIVPFLLNTLFQKVVYIWKCLPLFLLNIVKAIIPWSPPSIERYERFNAEMGFMAGQVGLPFDYCFVLVNFFMVFLMQGFVSPYSWRLLAAMCVWCPFYWFFSRYMHLRVQSVAYYSTNTVDWFVFLAWGIPLSLLAMASGLWFIRAGLLLVDATIFVRQIAVVGIFVLALLLWVGAFLVVSPWRRTYVAEDRPGEFQDCKNSWIFTWFNCNPIFTLKCAYHVQDDAGKTKPAWKDHPLASGENPDVVRYYRPGKEYLFMSKDKQALVSRGLKEWSAPETWLETLLDVSSILKKDIKEGKYPDGDFAEKARLIDFG